MRNGLIASMLIYSFGVFISCNNAKQVDDKIETPRSEYPTIIDSLEFRDLYNNTKWLMYCFQCDDTLKNAKSSLIKDSATFGMLNLEFDKIQTYGDSLLEINFKFYIHDTAVTDKSFRNAPIWGVVYSNSSHQVVYYSMYSDIGYRKDSCPPNIICKSRFVEPLQPEVVKYINNNKTKINPWFYEEAKRHGILK